mmetsp:Transcript_13922/g.32858  ORF Transcript_13922/g.32858 Transcript_13922/m.32858 type:complete len:267 (+) Transcript_13922:171-971(+)
MAADAEGDDLESDLLRHQVPEVPDLRSLRDIWLEHTSTMIQIYEEVRDKLDKALIDEPNGSSTSSVSAARAPTLADISIPGDPLLAQLSRSQASQPRHASGASMGAASATRDQETSLPVHLAFPDRIQDLVLEASARENTLQMWSVLGSELEEVLFRNESIWRENEELVEEILQITRCFSEAFQEMQDLQDRMQERVGGGSGATSGPPTDAGGGQRSAAAAAAVAAAAVVVGSAGGSTAPSTAPGQPTLAQQAAGPPPAGANARPP